MLSVNNDKGQYQESFAKTHELTTWSKEIEIVLLVLGMKRRNNENREQV